MVPAKSTRSVAAVESQLFDAEPNQLNWTDQQQRTLGRFLRYQTARANTVNRCRKAVEEFRKSRLSEKVTEQKLISAQTRIKTSERKNKPEPTWKEHLEGMRQKANAQSRSNRKTGNHLNGLHPARPNPTPTQIVLYSTFVSQSLRKAHKPLS